MPLGAFKAALMGTAGASTEGDVVLLNTATASGSSELAFTSGLDSTYGEYIFKFYNIHPSADGPYFGFQVNASGESGYNETITSTFFYAYHNEAGDSTNFTYGTSWDQAQGTGTQYISSDCDNDADSSLSGELHIFNPSSTTYVKHFNARTKYVYNAATTYDAFTGGYVNTTGAITQVQFKFGTGNIDTGTLKMWGVK